MDKKKTLLILWIIISVFGFIMVQSVEMSNEDVNSILLFIKNIVLLTALLSICIIVFYKNINLYRLSKKYANHLFYITVALLFIVLILGNTSSGASMVIYIFGFGFQPLELYKITLILYLAKLFDDIEAKKIIYGKFERVAYEVFFEKMFNKETFAMLYRLILPLVGLLMIFLQPDFGGMVISLTVAYMMLIYNGKYLKNILILSMIIIVLGIFSFTFLLHGYQLQRIVTWLNPFSVLSDDSLQIIQSFIGISNGGIFGVGLFNSIQKSILPVAESDFIFTIICEELGFAGAAFTIGLFMWISFIMMSVGFDSEKKFEKIASFGMASLIMFQSFIHIGGVTGVIPMTGVTLPFISKGINSYIFMSIGLFYIISIENYNMTKRKKKKRKRKRKGKV